LTAGGPSHTAVVVEGRGSDAGQEPATPAPEVTLDDHGFRTPGLPAVSADGTRVVHGEIENDGGRGHLNLRVVARDRSDKVIESITVLRASEFENAMGPGWRNPKLDVRISAANAWLAKSHRASALITLPQLKVDSTDGYTQHAASAGPVALDWSNDTVTIKLSGKVVTTYASPMTWHAPNTDKCQNPAKLGAAWVDAERKIALVQIMYNGTDMCWEPSPQHHVIAW
jgi:hypothetical protein